MSAPTNYIESNIALNFEDPNSYHDRVLIVGEKKFYVVSEVLSLWSEYFRGLFKGNFNEADKKGIELKELDADVFEIFLKLIYHNSSVMLKVADIIPLIELSYRFLTPIVSGLCKEYIAKNFDQFDEIKLELLDVACTYGVESLKTKLVNNLKEASELDKFSCSKVLEIAYTHVMEELKTNTIAYMKNHITYESCCEYLDCCDKFDLHELKITFSEVVKTQLKKIVPHDLIIELTKTGFKYDVASLKEKLRYCIFFLVEQCPRDWNVLKRNGEVQQTKHTFNWFLLDNYQEIIALPSEIRDFIILSTCKSDV